MLRMLYLQYIHSSNSHDLARKDIQRRVRTIMHHYNERINKRFQEFGVEDYCYVFDASTIEPRYGEQENFVNLTYST